MASGPRGKGSHHALDDSRAGVVEQFAASRAWKNTSGFWAVPRSTGRSGVRARWRWALTGLFGDEAAQVVVAELFDLRDLVRRAEAVEEVKEGNSRLQGGRMRDGRQVVGLLHRV